MQTTDSFEGPAPRFAPFKQEAMKELYKGNPLMGKGSIFTPLLMHFLEADLQGEMKAHLKEEQAKFNSNRRNGTGKKQVRSSMGKFKWTATAVGDTSRPSRQL